MGHAQAYPSMPNQMFPEAGMDSVLFQYDRSSILGGLGGWSSSYDRKIGLEVPEDGKNNVVTSPL